MSQEIHDRPRTPRAVQWAAWAVVVVALLLPAVLVAVVRRVLGGALDAQYFSSTEYDADGDVTTVTLDPDISFWDRWGLLAWSVPTDRVVVASTVVCVVLAGLHVAAGDRWPLQRAWRWAAAAACAVSAALAGALLVVQFANARLPESERVWSRSPDAFLEFAVPVATSATMLVFAVAAGVALLGSPVPRPDPVTAPEDTRETEPLEATLDVVLAVEPEPLPDPAPLEIPRLPAEEYALYRRPGA